MSSKTVGTRLKPGTAVNVTLWANYTSKEGSYDGQLVVFYVDGTESKRRNISVSSVRLIKIEFFLKIPLKIKTRKV